MTKYLNYDLKIDFYELLVMQTYLSTSFLSFIYYFLKNHYFQNQQLLSTSNHFLNEVIYYLILYLCVLIFYGIFIQVQLRI